MTGQDRADGSVVSGHFMNPLEDTQSQQDTRQVPIQRVGIRGLRYPVTLLCPGGAAVPTVVSATLLASLDASERGTHMSRFATLMHEYRDHIDPRHLLEMAAKLRASLKAETAQIILTFPWFVEKVAPITGQPGMVDYEVTWDVTVSDAVPRFLTSVVVPIATVCPCSKAISERGAHNQRGELTLTLASAAPPWLDDVIRIAEASASCELYSVLKRPDEKFVTERAYDSPSFVEDVVRQAALGLRALPGIQAFRAQAENFESIHSHNAFAMVEEGW
ncbi:MAG: cyclohydrolase FolE2 [Verrucomicrobiales bacterium]|nr:cyclohydrolase FolE2 [Verrucomicrobiales bacterium]